MPAAVSGESTRPRSRLLAIGFGLRAEAVSPETRFSTFTDGGGQFVFQFGHKFFVDGVDLGIG